MLKDSFSKTCEGRRKYEHSCTRLLNNLKYLRRLFEKPKFVKTMSYNRRSPIFGKDSATVYDAKMERLRVSFPGLFDRAS
jgi:hypothetical protein